MRLIIHAPNVHQGGGKTLLLNLITACGQRSSKCLALIDGRLDLPVLPRHIEIIRFPPTIIGRVAAELQLKARVEPVDTVLCMGNLPPLFQLRARNVILFLQNRYLLDALSTSGFSLSVRVRTTIERFWLRKKTCNVQKIVVQSPSMAQAVRRRLVMTPVIAPFATATFNGLATTKCQPAHDANEAAFVYIASGEPHKNHLKLVEAWILLSESGIRPLLRLTLNPEHHAELVTWIEAQCRKFKLRIENTGEISPEQLSKVYSESTALIYPSLAESLGLPLLEARSHGMPIIASERDYVRDAVTPLQTFDPESPLSISRAVRRFLGVTEPELKIRSAVEFLDMLLSDDKMMLCGPN